MNHLKTLVMMQLKDKMDLSFIKSTKATIFKVVFSLLKFAILTAIIYLAFTLISTFRLTSLSAGIPTSFFAIIFSIMILLSIIVCTFGLTKTLYLSRDNQVLLTMPTGRFVVFFSKMVVFTVYEFLRNLSYILPLFFAFGLVNAMPIYFYIWSVLACVIITLLTVTLGALFSIPMLFATFVVKKSKILEYSLIAIAVGALIFVVVSLINAIPQNLDIVGSWGTLFWDIQDLFTEFTQTFAPLYYLTIAFVGTRYGVVNQFFTPTQLLSLVVILGIIALVLALTFLIVRPLFFKMASKPFEYTRKLIETKKNKPLSPFFGGLKKELLITTRTSERFNSLFLVCLILPISILLLNKIFGAMDTRLSGTYLTLMFNVLLILLIALSSNGWVAKTFSQEGKSAYVNKTVPASFLQVLTSKIIINLVAVNISIIAAICIFANFAGLTLLQTIFAILAICSLFTGHLLWSATLDVMNPQTEEYATTGTHHGNPNETKSTIIAFVISALIAFIFLFLLNENVATVWTKIAFIGLAYLGWNIYMYISKVRVYYKEK